MIEGITSSKSIVNYFLFTFFLFIFIILLLFFQKFKKLLEVDSIFFENNSIEIIDPDVDFQDLEKFAREHGLHFGRNEAYIWDVYARKFGYERGLTEMEAESFGRVCSFLFSSGACELIHVYYNEDVIVDVVVDRYKRVQELNPNMPEEELLKRMFLFLFKLYKEDIEEYSFLRVPVQAWLTRGMKDYLDNSVPGSCTAEKIRFVVNYYKESQKEE